ncbi:C1orf50 family protein [Megaselia abdita]
MAEDRLTYQVAVKKAQLVERNPAGLLNPLRVSAHDELDIISLASQIQTADANLKHNASGKLAVILDQIKMLQAQAKQILEETDHNRQLHSAACNFTKKPGTIYHLYERSTGQTYFSMLSPEEWNGSNSGQKFLGSYRLEFDSSWTPVDKIREKDDTIRWAERCLSGGNGFLALENKMEEN